MMSDTSTVTPVETRTFRWSVGLLLVLAVGAGACTETVDDGVSAGTADEGPATAATESTSDGAEGPGGGAQDSDTFVIGFDGEPTTLDPAQAESSDDGTVAMLHGYDRLVEFGPEGPDLVPNLATEIPTVENGLVSEDGLTWTFPIREGVTFQDGTDLTAEDVKYSWDRVMEMNLPESQAPLFDIIGSTEAVDDYTFEVTLDEPSSGFLFSVAASMAGSVVSQDAVESNGGVVAGQPNEFMSANMVGSGPYVLEEWARGERLEFAVWEDYWGEPPSLDFHWVWVSDGAVASLGLEAGDYDYIEPQASTTAQLEGQEGIELYTEGLLLEPLYIGFNLRIPEEGQLSQEGEPTPPDFFHDPRVRQAFNYAYNYESLINDAFFGYGQTQPHILPEGVFGFDPSAPVYEHDPARAEELFRETGLWDEGFTVTVMAEADSSFETTALILKDSIEVLNPNFHVEVMAVPEARFDEIVAMDQMPVDMWVWNVGPFADPHPYFAEMIDPNGPFGTLAGTANGFEDPEAVSQLIEDAYHELDLERREEMYSELAQLLYDSPMQIIAIQEAVVGAYNADVQNFLINPAWPRPGINVALYDK